MDIVRLFCPRSVRKMILLLLLTALLPLMPAPAHSQDPGSPPVIPDPPAPMPLPAGTPHEQAIAFADAMDATPDPVAAWMGLYDALDIPVIAPDGTSFGVENGDPIGPQYWEVWYTSAATPAIGISLQDLGGMIALALEDTTHDYGALLLQDLRESATSPDPRAQLLAFFVNERMTRGGVSPLDATATPDQLTVDPAMVLLLGWSVIRATVYGGAAQSTSALPDGDAAFKLSPYGDADQPSQSTLSSTCMDGENSDEILMQTWTAFALGELRDNPRGFTNALKNVSLVLGDQMPTIVGHTPNLREVMPAGYMIALFAAGFRVDISAAPAPFTRTRSQAEWGESAEIKMALHFSTTTLPSGDLRSVCAAYFAAKAFGGKLNVPANGPIKSAHLIANIGANADRVGFTEGATADNNTSVSGHTNASGQLITTVKGRPQANEIPETAAKKDLEYSVIVVLDVDELVAPNGQRSLMVGGTTILEIPAGADSPLTRVLDQLRTRIRLGRYQFPFQDWEVQAWRAYIGNESTDTVVCDFENPISIYGTFQILGYEIEMTPQDATSGTYTQVIRPGDGTWIDLVGTYTLTHVENSDVVSVNLAPSSICVTDPKPPQEGGGTVCMGGPSMSAPIVFQAEPVACPEE